MRCSISSNKDWTKEFGRRKLWRNAQVKGWTGPMRYALSSIIVGTVLVGSAHGQTREENVRRCNENDPDVSIAGCTALIQSGQETTSILAAVFNNRGLAYKAKGDNDRAIQ